MPSIRKMTRAALVAMALALLAGCGGVQTVQPEMEAQARALLAHGRYYEAANEYLRLAAGASPPVSDEFTIKAAAALVDGGDIPAARRVLDEQLGANLGAQALIARDVLMARIALSERDPQRALDLLPADLERAVGRSLQRAVREIRVEALEALDRHLDAAAERVALERLLDDHDTISANQVGIWEAVSRLSPPELTQARTPPPDVLGGWLELAGIANRAITDPEALARELERWRLDFPAHPAASSIVPELLRIAEMGTTQPAQVALLLPLRGSFANAGEVIRDGFMAAWLDDGQNTGRPVVTVYDSSEVDVVALYHQAVANGAEFVVGPLQKGAVSMLAAASDLPVPVLALNYVDPLPAADAAGMAIDGTTGGTPQYPVQPQAEAPADASGDAASDGSSSIVSAPFYQFALSPEGEAENAAERAWFDGATRAALITPDSSLGHRIGDAFAWRWEELGGQLVGREVYADDARDLSEPIQRLLNLDRSEQRLRRLREVIGRGVHHEPRPRGDVDMIMMMGSATQGRQLNPQLSFHRAGDLPVYATSHVYGATPNPSQDLDLNGIRFGDMPWVLPEAGRDLRLRREMASAFPATRSTLRRLQAFGVDAYRLVPHLGRLRAQPFASIPGATGDLSVEEQNRVRRRLVWAHFVDGVPVLLDSGGGLLP